MLARNASDARSNVLDSRHATTVSAGVLSVAIRMHQMDLQRGSEKEHRQAQIKDALFPPQVSPSLRQKRPHCSRSSFNDCNKDWIP